MPLTPGKSQSTISSNIEELHHGPQYARTKAGHGSSVANKQAIAIAMSEARKSRKHGGRAAAEKALPANHQLGMRVPHGGSMCANCRVLCSATTCGNKGFIAWNGGATLPAPADEYCCDLYEHHGTKSRASGGKVMVGPIRGKDGGREDVHEAKVPDGAYILSADVVSHLGSNNTEAGLKKAHEIFGIGGHYDKSAPDHREEGGKVGESKKHVDCILASGEYGIHQKVVRKIGGGDMDHGHKVLDAWSMKVRKDHIDTLKNLPPPARD